MQQTAYAKTSDFYVEVMAVSTTGMDVGLYSCASPKGTSAFGGDGAGSRHVFLYFFAPC